MYLTDEYYLMHKDIKVAKFSMTDFGTDIKVLEVYNEKHMPFGTHVSERNLNEKFTKWKDGRRIPTERPYLMQIYKKTKKSIPELETYNLGLSLTDTYWYRPTNVEKKWKDINFHDNGFTDEIGKMLINANNDTPSSMKTPNVTISGECPKMWAKFSNAVNLVKGCRMYASSKIEICNEVFVSLLAEKLGINTVQYYMMRSGEKIDFCCAENFIKNDAFDFVSFEQIANDSETLGVKGVTKFIKEHNLQEYLNHMIVLDFIIGNYNRTLADIGILVHADTMEFVKPAPLFDYEESFDVNIYDEDIRGAFCDSMTEQLKMVSDYSWIDFNIINETMSEMDRVYSLGGFKSAEIKDIKNYFKKRVNLLKEHIPPEQKKLIDKIEYVPKDGTVSEDEIIKNTGDNEIRIRPLSEN